MSRSEYSDCLDPWDMIRYRGAVNSATKGNRGQKALRELAKALDEMPVKELIIDEFEFNGQYCALGALGKARGLNLSEIDPNEVWDAARAFNIAPALYREIVFMNDEGCWYGETPAQRWQRMRQWVDKQLLEDS